MGIKPEYNHQSRTNKLCRCAASSSASHARACRKFLITVISQLAEVNKYTKGLIIPENVKVAESRIPINSIQRDVLRKELLQSEVLAKMGYSVFLFVAV